MPAPSTHATATSRPPPLAYKADTSPHSAQRVRPYEAFSTLHPATSRPSSTRPAAPTANPEYLAYACCAASLAASLSLAQSTGGTVMRSRVAVGPGAAAASC